MSLEPQEKPLPPAVVDGARQVACLSLAGRLLTFGLDELKLQPNGGRGLTLIDLDAEGCAGQRGRVRAGAAGERASALRGGKPREETAQGCGAECLRRQAGAQGQGRRRAEGAAGGAGQVIGAAKPQPGWPRRAAEPVGAQRRLPCGAQARGRAATLTARALLAPFKQSQRSQFTKRTARAGHEPSAPRRLTGTPWPARLRLGEPTVACRAGGMPTGGTTRRAAHRRRSAQTAATTSTTYSPRLQNS